MLLSLCLTGLGTALASVPCILNGHHIIYVLVALYGDPLLSPDIQQLAPAGAGSHAPQGSPARSRNRHAYDAIPKAQRGACDACADARARTEICAASDSRDWCRYYNALTYDASLREDLLRRRAHLRMTAVRNCCMRVSRPFRPRMRFKYS